MIRILITGSESYVGENVRGYILKTSPDQFYIDTVSTMNDDWKNVDYSQYDVVYHVAGIAHVNADPSMKSLYYRVNRDLTLEVAKLAQSAGVKQFIFMSSQIVLHEKQSLQTEVITSQTRENPNGFYGDSKWQAEKGLLAMKAKGEMKICILRPPMIYGPNSKGNFPRLVWLARRTPVFPAWHNRRSMLYIDNLAEFVKQAVLHHLDGTFYPQNRELSDTVELVRAIARMSGHRVWISRLFNPCVWLGSFVSQPVNKMFATYYYEPEMSIAPFQYQIVSLWDSLKYIG